MEFLKEDSSRYYPILDSRFSGFVVLSDLKPGQEPAEGEEAE